MKKTAALFLATGLISIMAATAAEQPAGAPPPGAAPGGRGFQGRSAMPLDEQQRQTFQQALEKQNDKLRGLEEKLRAAQKELVDATLADNYDEQTVRAKAEAVAKIQVDITMIRAGALASVVPTLKPKQKQQLTDSRMAVMLLGGGFPGGPGGFGGRGPGERPGGMPGPGPRGERPARER